VRGLLGEAERPLRVGAGDPLGGGYHEGPGSEARVLLGPSPVKVVAGRAVAERSVAVAGAATVSTEVGTVAADAATSEVLEPDSGVKIVGQMAADWGSVVPERAATVFWKKFWNLPVEGVIMACLFRHCRKQVQDTHLRLAARQAHPSREAEGFE
jgi:hypothetical protein